MKNNNQKTTYIIICIICVICITITGAVLLKIQSVNNSQIMTVTESIVSGYALTTKVNINTASKSELMLLENIGSKIADNIIAYRKLKPFEKPEDLMNVTGIGKKTFERIKEFICIK